MVVDPDDRDLRYDSGRLDSEYLGSIVGNPLRTVHDLPELVAQGPLDFLLELLDRHVLSGFDVGQFRDITLGNQVTQIDKTKNAQIVAINH